MGVMLMSKLDAGNAILEATFIDKLNSKFEKPAQNPDSAHRPLGNIDLNQIFCWEYERQIQHDWTNLTAKKTMVGIGIIKPLFPNFRKYRDQKTARTKSQ